MRATFGLMLRAFLAVLLLGGLVVFLDQEQRAGRFRLVDEGFRDFLVANVRERFVPDPAAGAPAVALVVMQEAEAAEYEAWPPSPLDWQMLLQAVAQWQPEVLVIAEPLNWGQPSPPFVPAVAELLQAFPSVVLGVEAEYAAQESPAFLGGLEARLPAYPNVVGEPVAGAPWLKALVVPPDEKLRPLAELGLLAAPAAAAGSGQLPYAVQLAVVTGPPQWLPTLVAQAMSRLARSPYALQRLRLGAGAGVHLEGGRFVPLTADGHFEWSPEGRGGVLEVNALDLLAGGLAEVLPAETVAQANQARVVLIGLQRGDGTALIQQAEALAAMLALPTLQPLPLWGQWGLWTLAGLLGVTLVHKKKGALLRALIFVFAGFVISFLVFQSQLIWFPPTIPAALLLAGGLLGRLIGKGPLKPKAEVSEAQATREAGESAGR
jgi:hypothetical protein